MLSQISLFISKISVELNIFSTGFRVVGMDLFITWHKTHCPLSFFLALQDYCPLGWLPLMLCNTATPSLLAEEEAGWNGSGYAVLNTLKMFSCGLVLVGWQCLCKYNLVNT